MIEKSKQNNELWDLFTKKEENKSPILDHTLDSQHKPNTVFTL